MTSYNREQYISAAIESVIKSTYLNWELIIVDDASRDETVKIVESYVIKDPRIKLYKNDVNLGDYPNRNKAANYASGKYIKYIDADDMVYPHGIELMVSYMEKFPEAGWGVMSNPEDHVRPFPICLSPSEAYRWNYFNRQFFHRAPLSVIIKTDVFKQAEGFKNVRSYGDYDMWHRLAKKFSVVLMHGGLVWWRGHDQQESSYDKNDPYNWVNYVNVAIEHIIDVNCPLTNSEKKILLKKFRNNHIGRILRNIKSGNAKIAFRIFKKAKWYQIE